MLVAGVGNMENYGLVTCAMYGISLPTESKESRLTAVCYSSSVIYFMV